MLTISIYQLAILPNLLHARPQARSPTEPSGRTTTPLAKRDGHSILQIRPRLTSPSVDKTSEFAVATHHQLRLEAAKRRSWRPQSIPTYDPACSSCPSWILRQGHRLQVEARETHDLADAHGYRLQVAACIGCGTYTHGMAFQLQGGKSYAFRATKVRPTSRRGAQDARQTQQRRPRTR